MADRPHMPVLRVGVHGFGGRLGLKVWPWHLDRFRKAAGLGIASNDGSGFPRGSKYPIFKDSGSKVHTLNGFWNQGP